ncbi:hypothetical protein A2U01_0063382, partial [Trifolium medium]|nr:hypothetical protein [Trifolium medium]
NHEGYFISSINTASFNLATSSAIAARLSSPTFLFLWEMVLTSGNIDNLCVITFSSIPGISEDFQAKRSTFSLKIFSIRAFSAGCKAVPKFVVWCTSSPI